LKILFATLCAVLATTSLALSAEDPWSLTLASEVRYFSWEGEKGTVTGGPLADGGGSQLYIPYAAKLSGKVTDDLKLDILGRGGWVSAEQTTEGAKGKVETITDIVGSATATYYGISGFQPFVAVSVNLPTGKAELAGSDANARMDPDLVDVGSFGEGFNIGPTVGVTVPITVNFLITASAGYTWRGEFARESSLAAIPPFTQMSTDLDPGDVFTVTAGMAFQSGQFSAQINGSVSEETTTRENGIALYKGGRRYLVSGTFSYAWETIGTTTITAAAAHSEKNEVLFAGVADIVKEPFNTNSNLYRIGFQHLVPLGQFAIGPIASFLYRDHNSYDQSTLQFVPQKERWATGALARYAFSDNIVLNARFEYVWTREDDRPAPGGQVFSVLANGFIPGSAVPHLDSEGLQAAFGLNISF
jgi:hypothetical protein